MGSGDCGGCGLVRGGECRETVDDVLGMGDGGVGFLLGKR